MSSQGAQIETTEIHSDLVTIRENSRYHEKELNQNISIGKVEGLTGTPVLPWRKKVNEYSVWIIQFITNSF